MTKPKKLIPDFTGDDLLDEEFAKELVKWDEELTGAIFLTSCLYCNYDGAQTIMSSTYKVVCVHVATADTVFIKLKTKA